MTKEVKVVVLCLSALLSSKTTNTHGSSLLIVELTQLMVAKVGVSSTACRLVVDKAGPTFTVTVWSMVLYRVIVDVASRSEVVVIFCAIVLV